MNGKLFEKIYKSINNHPEEWSEGYGILTHESGLQVREFNDTKKIVVAGTAKEGYSQESLTFWQRLRLSSLIYDIVAEKAQDTERRKKKKLQRLIEKLSE